MINPSFAAGLVFQNTVTELLESSSSSDGDLEFQQYEMARKKKSLRCRLQLFSCLPYFIREDHEKLSGFVDTVIPNMGDWDFWKNFRMNRETFKVLTDFIDPHFKKLYRGGNTPMSTSEAVFIYLNYISTQIYIREIGLKFGRSTSSAWLAITQVTEIIVKHGTRKFIQWPDQSGFTDVVEAFREKGGIPGIIGAIDGCHIRIQAPLDDHQSYQNRKMFHSVLLLGVCLANRLFSYVSLGMPGSAHDARALKWSSLWRKVHIQRNSSFFPSQSLHIIGDSAFPCIEWLIPVLKTSQANTNQKRRFNKKLSRARVVIENTFGDLLNRFRRLRMIRTKCVERAILIASSACVIHNLCLLNGDLSLLPASQSSVATLQSRINVNSVASVPTAAGTAKRNAIIAMC